MSVRFYLFIYLYIYLFIYSFIFVYSKSMLNKDNKEETDYVIEYGIIFFFLLFFFYVCQKRQSYIMFCKFDCGCV